MANSVHAIIWDLDGVIIDSAEAHRRSWYRLAGEEDLPFTDEQFWATFGWRNDAIIPKLWGVESPERVREFADRKEAYFREFVRDIAAPLPGSIELLSSLRDAGYPQALASSTPIANIELISDLLGLKHYLNALISGETVPHGKPAPDLFLKAAATLGVEAKKCLVIEDAVAGIEAARAGGMYSIAVAGERDLPGLKVANLVVKDLTEVNVERIRELA
ncbi:HAD family phosphatase [Ktedonosporobacter rubrisoli]|uniref:HAD family phosphatase n=1 Tax=Ktedonosporobacter rubrisoli TaxID=2509675 RepID=A0A4P6K3B3_KTERU|nr:HAD family phosphatase [Ktedonosporobacter rubrisoli]QBD82634.1 HAD family phosphatase [Ktedonosporobacter rubrisoli]